MDDENHRIDFLVQRDRPSEDSRRVVRGMRIWQLTALDSFDYLSAWYARGRWPSLYSTSFPFFGRTPNDSDTLTPMNLFLVLWPGICANASTMLTFSSGSLTCERLRMQAVTGLRITSLRLRASFANHASRLDPHS